MSKAGWVLDENDEACYIDIDDDDSDPDHEYSQWNDLPDLLLEDIFSYLNTKERYYASLVCRNWYRAFHLPGIWSNFLVEDNTLARAKYNYYAGWQYVLDHMRTQYCFVAVGHYIKGLDFRPTHSFYNLYQFMTLMTWHINEGRKSKCAKEFRGIGDKIKRLNYIFPCNMASTQDPESIKLFGTGGELLLGLKKLLFVLYKLEELKLVDLLLERYEAKHLLDEVLESCAMKLKVLHLINVTSVHCPIMHVGLFLNLKILVIAPQNIDDDVLTLLADSRVKHLHILQNRYAPKSVAISSCSDKAWRIVKRDNPNLRVHLRVESTTNEEIVFQPEAPVCSIVYSTPKTNIKSDLIVRICDHYKATLRTYGHEMLPKFQSAKSFNIRIDSLLLLMARQCYYLKTLVVREKVSTSTILLIARAAQNLQFFHVRQNAVILRCDWPKNPEWTDDFYHWLKGNSQSYASTEREVSRILGRHWTMLSDQNFKKIMIHVRD